ncbi:MAG: hypothetical protein ACKVYV_15750 [Limisphaerales bacterium]
MLLSLAVLFAGCASSKREDNLSERPWNSPKGWETGFPTGMTEGR